MVTHRLFRSSYIFYCFFYRPTQRVGLSLFFSLFFFVYWPTHRVGLSWFFFAANSTCWPITLQPDGSHRLFVTRLPTCSGNTSWDADHWQQQETWRHPIPRACMYSQAKPDQPYTAHAELEIWFGRRYCHWELKTKSLVNGLRLGMGRIRLIRFYLGMHTCSKNWMASSFLLLSMVSISRSIARACGKACNEKPMRSIWL